MASVSCRCCSIDTFSQSPVCLRSHHHQHRFIALNDRMRFASIYCARFRPLLSQNNAGKVVDRKLSREDRSWKKTRQMERFEKGKKTAVQLTTWIMTFRYFFLPLSLLPPSPPTPRKEVGSLKGSIHHSSCTHSLHSGIINTWAPRQRSSDELRRTRSFEQESDTRQDEGTLMQLAGSRTRVFSHHVVPVSF